VSIKAGTKFCVISKYSRKDTYNQSVVTILQYEGGTKFSVKNKVSLRIFMESYPKLNKHQCKLINFSVSRKGVAEHDAYKFERMLTQGGAFITVIAEIYDKSKSVDDRDLGYIFYNSITDKVVAMRKAHVLANAEKVSASGKVLFHNLIFENKTEQRSARFRQFTKDSIPCIEIETVRQEKSANIYTKSTTKESANAFTPEQLRVLKEAKSKGERYERVARPELSPDKMIELLKIDKLGFDCRKLASDKYSLDVLKFYRAEIKLRHSLRPFAVKVGDKVRLTWKYNSAQMFQISLGNIAGIDYKQYMKPEIKAFEMEEVRCRLENGLWSSNDDSTWGFKVK